MQFDHQVNKDFAFESFHTWPGGKVMWSLSANAPYNMDMDSSTVWD